MLNTQTITTKELRDNLSEILEQVAIGRKSFVVSKFGKIKAVISPAKKKAKKAASKKYKNAGEWLQSLIDEAEKLGVAGPPDLASNMDKYLYGEKK